MDEGSSESFLNACSPPTGTYRKSPAPAVIHFSPLYRPTSPESTKKDSEIDLWK